jgi:hypothetical protein
MRWSVVVLEKQRCFAFEDRGRLEFPKSFEMQSNKPYSANIIRCRHCVVSELNSYYFEISTELDSRDSAPLRLSCFGKRRMKVNTLTIDIPADQVERLNRVAVRRGVSLQDLLRQLAEDCVTRDDAIETSTNYVLKKNAELYRRLAK